MSQWRDARLLRALQAAPDQDLLPHARTRRAIHAGAREALDQAAGRASWWKRWWLGAGAGQMPWNAAFATIALASLITVLWHDREVLDAKPSSALADRAMPMPAAAPVPAAAPDSASAPESAAANPPDAASPLPARPSHPAALPNSAMPAPASQHRRSDALEKSQSMPGPAPIAPSADPAPRERRAESGSAELLRDQAVRPPAKAAVPDAEMPRQAAERAVAQAAPAEAAAAAPAPSAGPVAAAPARPMAALAPAAAPAPVPAAAVQGARPQLAAPATAAVARSSASASSPAAQRESWAAADAWTDARLLVQGRGGELPLAQAPRLAELIRRLAREAQSTEPLAQPATLRIELRGPHAPTAMLEIAGPQVRWTEGREAASRSATGRPDAALLQALQEEIGRAFAR